MSAPPIHAHADRASCFSGILHLRTSQLTRMPASDRFLMAFALEQFLAALHLGVVTILNLEPRCALRRVRREAVLGYDALKIHLAHTLKQRLTVLLDVVRVPHTRFRNLRHETPKLLFAVCQFLRPQIFAISSPRVSRHAFAACIESSVPLTANLR